jgi:hypothetical protein
MMGALQRLFVNGHAKPAVPDEVESAVNGVLREAEELRRLLRDRRERRRERADTEDA